MTQASHELSTGPAPIRLIEWDPLRAPALAAAFERLNREWIEAYFAVEPRDEAMFADPASAIVGRGGALFFLLEAETPVGCCALVPESPGVFQLGKMAVTASARGRGHGERLLAHALGWAAARGARQVALLTNITLAAAGALYRKHGFRDVPFTAPPGYVRSNARMVLDLPSSMSASTTRVDPPAATRQ